MFSLKTGYFFAGLTTGLLLLINFLGSLPDGKLHIVFCSVGQGDSAYIIFPDGRDMLVDGGPNDSVLGCLGRHMPFWDRSIDIVVLTHPEKDHMQGLLSVIERYQVGYLVRSDIANTSEGFGKLLENINKLDIKQKMVTKGERVMVGHAMLDVVWPTTDKVLGMSTENLNTGSVVFWLRYGTFDALFTGDASLRTSLPAGRQAVEDVEVLKIPHHGSKTEFSKDYLNKLKPKLAVISVGKNSFGHPTQEVLSTLADINAQVLRTDQEGDIEIVSDGVNWTVIE